MHLQHLCCKKGDKISNVRKPLIHFRMGNKHETFPK